MIESKEDILKVRYSDHLPDLLNKLDCVIALSTYQAGKVVFLAPSGDRIIQMPRHFRKPMGLTVQDDYLAVASLNQVDVFGNSPEMAKNFPQRKGIYDMLYLPRVKYYTGELDIHDLLWYNDGLVAVNTRFSCLAHIGAAYGFDPIWQPPFISELRPEDRCHLNGLCLKDGQPKYVSALSTTDVREGWRENITESGVVMDVTSNTVVLDNLPMPHSPRLYGNSLYVLLSATGELVVYDLEKDTTNIYELGGFVRGLAEHRQYLFIGTSEIRKSSKTFNKLPVAQQETRAGLKVMYQPTNSIVAELEYLSDVNEIYDIQILPVKRIPGMITTDNKVHELAVVAPELYFWKVPKKSGNKSKSQNHESSSN